MTTCTSLKFYVAFAQTKETTFMATKAAMTAAMGTSVMGHFQDDDAN